MSQEINNREYRQQVIKDLIRQLHEGKTVDEVKGQFERTFKGVSAAEISEAEQALIREGLPVEEVQRLCDVHAAVFKGSIEEIHSLKSQTELPGHPVYVLKQENSQIAQLIENQIKPNLQNLSSGDQNAINTVKESLNLLGQIDVHYKKKENLFFPYMEKYGITAPPKVMWGVDDEIRSLLKKSLSEIAINPSQAKVSIEQTITKILDMIYKEEKIMLPMLEENLTVDEWKQIADDSYEIGFCLIDTPPKWDPAASQAPTATVPLSNVDTIDLDTGFLNRDELIALLNTLPFDITFVDKDDTVKYFSQGTERIFTRTKSVIGRKVTACHPPSSVHIVEQIVESFKSGKKDHEDFWIKMGDKYVFIRYFAVRSQNGEYLGTLEVTQNIAPIQLIEGEKRLIDM
ncbi:MAG TPA: DUF438 domain-containing protein [Clostridiales bacterium]|nr:DUF438 domain-containing protein [Clostridiales bacterium]